MQSYLSYLRAGYGHWVQLWQDKETPSKHPFFELSLRTGTLLALYVFADRLLMRMTPPPFAYYREPFIYWGFLKHVFSNWYIIPFVFALIAAFFFRRELFRPWTDLGQGKSLRFLLTLAAGLLAWPFATYDYSLYFDQGHYADRLLLLLLVPMIYWRPVFVLPFLTALLPVIWQFTVLVAYSWAAPFLLIRLLTLFVACFAVQAVAKRFPLKDFVFLSGCLLAAHYWLSGWGKFSWDWFRYDEVLLMLPYSYSNGWLKQLHPDTILAVLQALNPLNGFFKVFVLVVEFGSFLFFYSPKFPLFFLSGWMLFHVGVFLFSGICFWMWVTLEIGFLWLFLRKGGFLSLPVFTRSHLLLSTVLIVSGSYWCKPAKLFWYDLPFSYSYRVEATAVDGEIYQLPPTFFSPYDYQFIMSGLAYLGSHPVVLLSDVREYPGVARQLMAISSADEFFVKEKLHGGIKYYSEGATSFDLFVKEFVTNWNRRLSKDTWLSHLQAPGLLWNHREGKTFEPPRKIARIKIIQVTSLFGRGHYAEIRKIPVYERSF